MELEFGVRGAGKLIDDLDIRQLHPPERVPAEGAHGRRCALLD